MRLISTLKNVILFEVSQKDRGTVLFSKVVDNKLIQLKSTFHQRKERFGSDSYDDIVDKYKEYLDTRKSKYQQEPRLAVPDSMIKNIFSKNVEKIYKSFEDEPSESKRIIFVHKRKDNAFSDDGKFIKTKNEEKKSNRVMLEYKFKHNYPIVYL